MLNIHAHLFNLKYLPVAGIIVNYSNGIVPNIIARGVARLLLRRTQSSIPLSSVSAGSDPSGTLRNLKEDSLLRQQPVFEITYEQIKQNLLDNVNMQDLFDSEIQDAISEFSALQERYPTFPYAKPELKPTWHMQAQEAESWIRTIGDMIDWVFSKIEDGINYLRWFHFMQSSEHDMLSRLQKDEPGITRFVFHMMDADNYFPYSSDFDFESVQIPKMETLLKQFPEKLIGFVAFDPARNNAINIIEDAILNKGFSGVKFYPPLGYAPTGNTPKIQTKIDALYDFCIKYDVPILSHCNNQGFEANRKQHSGYNSNPLGWQSVLQNKKYSNLRLCLAHAGGVEGWFAKPTAGDQTDPATITDTISNNNQKDWNSSYAKIVYKLCMNYPNVYCDAAYLDEITNNVQYGHFKDRLIDLFLRYPDFSKKIIYGSDWHMLFQEGKNGRYFSDYLRLFSEQQLNAFRTDFFEKNALNYLNLKA